MDDPHEQEGPGRDLPVLGEKGGRFKPLPADLGPMKRAFLESLREHFETCGLSLSQFAAKYYYADRSTVWRYLNAVHMPDGRFVRDVLNAAESKLGTPMTAQVRKALEDLHLAALNGADDQKAYETERLRRDLLVKTLQVQAAQRQVEMLDRELAESRDADARLRSQVRELEAAQDEQQIRHGAELAVYQDESSRLRNDLIHSRERIKALEILLEQAQVRQVAAEKQCERLERSLAATAEDIERDRREEMRRAEERDRERQAQESAMRASLAEFQRRSEERETELAHLRRLQYQRLVALFARRVRELSGAVERQRIGQTASALRPRNAPQTTVAPPAVHAEVFVPGPQSSAVDCIVAPQDPALGSARDLPRLLEEGAVTLPWRDPGEAAAVLAGIGRGATAEMLAWMAPDAAAAVLARMGSITTAGVLARMGPVAAAEVLTLMDPRTAANALAVRRPDAAAKVLDRMSHGTAVTVLFWMAADAAVKVLTLMTPDATAAVLVRVDRDIIIRVLAGMTPAAVSGVLAWLTEDVAAAVLALMDPYATAAVLIQMGPAAAAGVLAQMGRGAVADALVRQDVNAAATVLALMPLNAAAAAVLARMLQVTADAVLAWMAPSATAEVLAQMDRGFAGAALLRMDPGVAAKVLVRMGLDAADNVLGRIDLDAMAGLLVRMDPGAAAPVLTRMVSVQNAPEWAVRALVLGNLVWAAEVLTLINPGQHGPLLAGMRQPRARMLQYLVKRQRGQSRPT